MLIYLPGCGEILLAIPNAAGYDTPLSIIRSRDQRLVFALSGVTSICHGLSQSWPVASGCRHSVLLRRLRFLRRFHPPYPTIAPPAIVPLSCLFHSLGAWSISSCQSTRKLRFWSKVQTGSVTALQTMISRITLLLLCRPAADQHTPSWY